MENAVDRYTYQVIFSEGDSAYVATCVEFPRLSHQDVDAESALKGIRELIEFVIKQLLQRNQPLPEPVEKRGSKRRTPAPRRDAERRTEVAEAPPKRDSKIRRVKANRRYYGRRVEDPSPRPRSSDRIEQRLSNPQVAGSNPAGGAKPVVCYEWIESERGWGQRPDGITLHLDNARATAFLEKYYADQPKEVPDEYSRHDGQPFVIDVDEATYSKVIASKNGIRLWQDEARTLLAKARKK